MPFVRAWEAKKYLDYHCLYALVFSFLAIIFLHLIAGLESRLFLSMLVIFYYFLIKKTDIKYVSFCTFYLLFQFKIISNSILLYSWQLKACSIFILAAADDIFFIGAIDKVIKSIAEYIR